MAETPTAARIAARAVRIGRQTVGLDGSRPTGRLRRVDDARTRAVRVRVHGVVQEVGFRAWTVGRADALGLSGWVRNRTDGCVDAHLEGHDDAIEAMLGLLAGGPPAAVVDRVEVEDVDPAGLAGFAWR